MGNKVNASTAHLLFELAQKVINQDAGTILQLKKQYKKFAPDLTLDNIPLHKKEEFIMVFTSDGGTLTCWMRKDEKENYGCFLSFISYKDPKVIGLLWEKAKKYAKIGSFYRLNGTIQIGICDTKKRGKVLIFNPIQLLEYKENDFYLPIFNTAC